MGASRFLLGHTILQRQMTVQDAHNDAAQKVLRELDEAYRYCGV